MNILVACEESQRVTEQLRLKGCQAFSCDVQSCSGGHYDWHIKGDVLPLLNGRCGFFTMDGNYHVISGKWDMIIAFPPCTNLACSGARHFEKKRENGVQLESLRFFNMFLLADCDKIAIENPINIVGSEYVKRHFPMYSDLPKPSQRIQPYEYGEPFRKTTCLWLKGLPNLEPTHIVEPQLVSYVCKNGKKVTFSSDYGSGGKNAGKRRSKTYIGIAQAMASQWV